MIVNILKLLKQSILNIFQACTGVKARNDPYGSIWLYQQLYCISAISPGEPNCRHLYTFARKVRILNIQGSFTQADVWYWSLHSIDVAWVKDLVKTDAITFIYYLYVSLMNLICSLNSYFIFVFSLHSQRFLEALKVQSSPEDTFVTTKCPISLLMGRKPSTNE